MLIFLQLLWSRCMYLLFSWMDFQIGNEVEDPNQLMNFSSSVLQITFCKEIKIVVNNIFNHVKQVVKWFFHSSGCLWWMFVVKTTTWTHELSLLIFKDRFLFGCDHFVSISNCRPPLILILPKTDFHLKKVFFLNGFFHNWVSQEPWS